MLASFDVAVVVAVVVDVPLAAVVGGLGDAAVALLAVPLGRDNLSAVMLLLLLLLLLPFSSRRGDLAAVGVAELSSTDTLKDVELTVLDDDAVDDDDVLSATLGDVVDERFLACFCCCSCFLLCFGLSTGLLAFSVDVALTFALDLDGFFIDAVLFDDDD